MSVPLTNLHQFRVIEQIQANLIGLQSDMRRNALAHKQMALAQSPDLTTVQQYVADCAAQYARRVQWVDDLLADASRYTALLEALGKYGLVEADITDVLSSMRPIVIAFSNAPSTTYAEVIAACDAVLAAVAAPDSLWPE